MTIKGSKINGKNVIVGILLLIIMSFGVKYKYDHTFSTDKWIKHPSERVKIVDNMLRRYRLVGETKDQIVELLGEETSTEYFEDVDNLVYYLGDERGFISIDSEWLIIMFDDNLVVEAKVESD